MKNKKRILLTMATLTPALVMPIISISCVDNESLNQNLDFDKKIAEFEILFNNNKNSLSLDKKDKQDYELFLKNAKQYFKDSTSKEQRDSFINIVESKINEITQKEQKAKNLTDEQKLQRAKELLFFSYPNIENTKLSDADESLIQKYLVKEFEFSLYKTVKNEETQDITIIYKLKNKQTNFEHSKNQFFELKGWKKSDKKIEKEKKQLKHLEENLNTLKVRFLDEKAYQNVLKTNSLLNFDGKPNFVIADYDKENYTYELLNLIKNDNNEYKVNVRLSLKSNNEIKMTKEILIDKEKYGRSNFINPHNLTNEQQINFLKDQLRDTEIYPYYSKDKTFLERKEYQKLTNKSYWLTKKNNQLFYNFKQIKDEGENKKLVVEVYFENWNESPKYESELNINFSKLGIEELNEIRKKSGKEPLEDIKAPESTLPEEKTYEKIELIDFVPTTQDEYFSINSPHHHTILKKFEKNLYLLNQKVKDLILLEKDNFLKAQHFAYDNEKFETKTELFVYHFSKEFQDYQNVLILSNPIIKYGEVESIKLTIGSLSDIINKDYSKLSSKRINLIKGQFGEKKLKSYELFLEIKQKNFHVDPTYEGEYTKDDFDISKLKYNSKIPEGYELIKPTKAKLNKKQNKWSVPIAYKKGDIISNNFWSDFKVK